MTPAELLLSIRGWIGQLSAQYARRLRLDSDDVFQESATLVLKHAGSFDPAKGSALTWSKYAVRSAAHKLARKKPKELGTKAEVLGAIEARDDWQAWETEFDLRTSLASLPPEERAVVELRFGLTSEDGLSRTETGEAIGASASYVARVEKDALNCLRKLFA